MATMIERVARALSESDGQFVQPQPWHFDYARAAIAAMRVPTEGMSEALRQATYEECGYPSDWMGVDAPTVFAAAIDAALEEKP